MENQQKQASATNYIEIDNVRFETWMPKREITIPLIKQQTPLELGIRITNNTPNNFYFCFFSSLSPKLIAPNGQVLQLGACTDGIRFADKYDFMQVMRWQAVTFCFESGFSWSIYRKNNRKKRRDCNLIFGINRDSYCRNEFTKIQSIGTYQFQWEYHENSSKIEYYKKYGIDPNILQEVWIGELITPPVELSLVLPKIEVALQ